MKKSSKTIFILMTILSAMLIGAIAVLSVLVGYHNIPRLWISISYFVLGVTLALSFFVLIYSKKMKEFTYLEKRNELWNDISYRVKGAGEGAFNNIPIGIILFSNDGIVEWSNQFARNIFQNKLENLKLDNIDSELYLNIIKKRSTFIAQEYGKTYECNIVKNQNILYMKDITEKVDYLTRYKNRTMAIGILNIDNLSNALSPFDAKDRSIFQNKLISIISEWEEKYSIYVSASSQERYLILADRITLEEIIKDNFTILEDIRDYFATVSLRVTASIGFACGDLNTKDLTESAFDILQMALDRGGDQSVVKIDSNITYYGAKDAAIEDRTAVEVRFKTSELCDLIAKYNKVYIMAHSGMDTDAFGSSIALYRLAKALRKDAKIVYDDDKVDKTVKSIYASIKSEHQNLLECFISPQKANREIGEDSLLIITDCQYKTIVFDDKLYRKATHIAMLDHHRRNANSIDNYEFVYVHPSASSAVELVVEMYEYIPEEVKDNLRVSSIEATWMLMGIQVDTNNFAYRTTQQTFLVLGKLQSFGASTATANRYLREEYDAYVQKQSIISDMEIYREHYAIGTVDEIVDRPFIAKVADELVLIDKIKLSFCIGRISDDTVSVSARSLDEGNAQIIMERLGGGGHYNNAAAQIKGATVEEVKARLKDLIDNVYQGENTAMKLILVKDVKGKGKINDVIDVPAGYANYLLRGGMAVEATADNLKKLDEKLNIKKIELEQELQDAKKLAERLNTIKVKIYVRIGEQGKLFGSVTSKQIVETLLAQEGIDIDKRKVMLEKDIASLGTYNIPIHLHKEVTATLVVYVMEKE